MIRWMRYAGVSAFGVAAVVALLWSGLGSADRKGLLVAGILALGVQWTAFGLLLGLRDRGQGFLLAMALGTAARFGVLGAAGVVVTVTETGVSATALVLGLAGFLFALALMEAVFLRGGETMRRTG